jgi:transposase InsO family protein
VEDDNSLDNRQAVNDPITGESIDANGTFDCHCHVSEVTESHYLDTISYPVQQASDHLPKEFDEVFHAFPAYCEEAWLLGETSSNLLVNDITTTQLHLRSVGIMTAKVIQGISNDAPLKVLFDTGSDLTLFNERALPKNAKPKLHQKTQNVTGVHGTSTLKRQVLLENMSLPEFSPTQRIPGPIRATVFQNPDSNYDIILGMDFMQAVGIDVHCTTQRISWNGNTIPFRPKDYFSNPGIYDSMVSIMEDDPLDNYYGGATGHKFEEILPSKYNQVDTTAVAEQQKHLTERERKDLAMLLAKFPKLFSGVLDTYPHRKIHIDLNEGAQPVAARPYPVPKHHEAVFKAELKRLCEIGVLERTGASQWLSPTFIIPKKDGRVRWISDMRALNKVIKRKVYNLPKIQDILKKRPRYEFLTKIDLSLHYYTFELDDESKDLCSICTPFGNYRYRKMVMGLSFSPDTAQEIMESIFRDEEDVDNYIDDVGVFSLSWDDHVRTLERVLKKLQDNNFIVNPLKCEWGVRETDWLGYWLTPTGLKPWRKKIDAILAIKEPTTPKELRSFIGAVTFYRDMFPRRSHLLAPLTAQAGRKKTIDWTPECQSAFDAIKATIAKDAFTRYPDHNLPFHIYCDASDYQLGAAIFQEGVPVAYYSRKLNTAQRNYTVGEKELLSIVETLKEYRSMLYGCPNLHLYTDHRNNTFAKFNSQRVMRWRLFLEDYAPTFHYIKGEDNPLADALSRLSFDEGKNSSSARTTYDLDDTIDRTLDPLNAYYSMAVDDDCLLDCFVNLPDSENVPFSMDYQTIADAQMRDAHLIQLAQEQPTRYAQQMLAPDIEVYCYTPQGNGPWKICIPTELLDGIVRWYHLALGHVGISRLYDTVATHFHHRQLRLRVNDLVEKCDTCQRLKQVGRGHGELAPREAEVHPWRTVAVDLIGPWNLRVGDELTSFTALTVIDTVTNLAELIRLDNKSSAHVSMQFENCWLSRYPRPTNCIYDQGKEFIGWPFQHTLRRHGIKGRPTSVKNPQANAICERMHQAAGNTLRVLSTLNPPQGIDSAERLVDMALANTMFATRATLHGTLRSTPGAIAFSRDMVLDIPLVADFQVLQERRQQLIDKRLIESNRKRFSYDYRVGDRVLKLTYKPNKLEQRAVGPYPIVTVHQNGTLTIQLTPTTLERISIRRVKPYRS